MGRILYPCEFCQELKCHSLNDTVCEACDFELKEEQDSLLKAREARWAEKYKCRECGEGLPLSRYYCHEDCRELESESEFDSCADMDCEIGDSVHIHKAKVKDLKNPKSSKPCTRCGVVKSNSEFNFNSECKYGRLNQCKSCVRIPKRKNENSINLKV